MKDIKTHITTKLLTASLILTYTYGSTHLISAAPAQAATANATKEQAAHDPTAWFAGRWGVFYHYLATGAGKRSGGISSETWNKHVDSFDVKGLAKQLHSIGASYIVITIGQGSGHFCAPNPVYDKLTGVKPSKCSRRDLISDLHKELHPLGIKIIVYSAAEIAWGDKQARIGLKLKHHHNDPGSGGYKIWKKHRQVEFMRNIEAIHTQWSKQWGKKVAGWWIDGCYLPESRFVENDPPNFATFKAALRTGNPNAIIAFNSGVKVPAVCTTQHDDYVAGEFSTKLPGCPGPWLTKNGHRARYHSLSYVGSYWGKGSKPRFSNPYLINYTTAVTSKGGFVTWDVPHTATGLIPEAFIKQLETLPKPVKK